MPKILLTGTYCSFNKGDAAMELATVEAIQSSIPNAEVTISSPFPEYDSAFYHPVSVIKSSRRRLIWATFKLMLLVIWSFFHKKGINLDFLVADDELQGFISSDVVIDLSGDMQTEDYGVHVAYSHYLPLLKALAANKPLILCAQSIGPFKWTTPIARYIFNHAYIVTTRDQITTDYLASIGIPANKYMFTADMAFLLNPVSDDYVEQLLMQEGVQLKGEKVFGVSLSELVANKFEMHNPNKAQGFIEFISNEIATICNQYDLTPLFVSHVTGPTAKKDDRIISKKVSELVAKATNKTAFVLTGNYKPNELKGVIKQCHIFMGARMHANIAALSSGVPVLAISYSHKTPGIMQMFRQKEMVAEIEYLDSSMISNKLEKLLTHRDAISTELREALVFVQERAELNVELIRQVFLDD